MPLPANSFTIHGGCNCRAVRYNVSIPPLEERPKTVYCTPGAKIPDDARLPAIYIDHCNDCRRATSSILPTWLITKMDTVMLSCMPLQALPATGQVEAADSKRQWRPAGALLRDDLGPTLEGTSLGHYVSSEGRNRWFCTHCGTPIAYSIWDDAIPKEWGWPKMLDICLGTVDREDLDHEYMKPERRIWCDKRMPWIFEMATEGAKTDGVPVPQHPLTKIDIVIGEDTVEDKEGLEGYR